MYSRCTACALVRDGNRMCASMIRLAFFSAETGAELRLVYPSTLLVAGGRGRLFPHDHSKLVCHYRDQRSSQERWRPLPLLQFLVNIPSATTAKEAATDRTRPRIRSGR